MKLKNYYSRVLIIPHSALSDIAIWHAVYILCCACMHGHLLKRQKKTLVLKNLAPAAIPVSYKNQKNAWMDVEILRGRVFCFYEFPHCPTVILPPTGPV